MLLLAPILLLAQDLGLEPPRYLGVQTLEGSNGVVADVDGDGDDDLILADRDVYWLEQGSQGGIAAAHVILPGRAGIALIAEDMDGDGDMDLLFGRTETPGVRTIEWIENRSGGRFAETPEVLDTLFGNEFITVDRLDADQDGRMDVLIYTAGGSTLDWYRNEGSGVFSSRAPLVPIPVPNARMGQSFDLGLDGDLDFLFPTSGNGIWIVENLGALSFAPPTPLDVAVAIVQTAAFEDLDGDGQRDLLILHGDLNIFGQFSTLSVYLGQGAGSLGPRQELYYANDPFEQDLGTPRLADLDGDGDMDLAFTGSSKNVLVMENQGAGAFSAPVPVPLTVGSEYRLLDLGELDGQPGVDAFVLRESSDEIVQVLGGAPGPTFDVASDVLKWDSRDGFQMGDIDGDGDVDVVFGDRTQRLGINDGLGHLESVDLPAAVGFNTDVSLADLDDDGDLDLLVLNFSGDARWFDNLGALVFGPSQSLDISALNLDQLRGIDVDGDGMVDIVSTNDNFAWSRNLGAGMFAPFALLGMDFGDTEEAEFTDLDGDGDVDALTVERTSTNLVLRVGLNQTPVGGPADFQTSVVSSYPGFFPMDLSAGDLDGDGDPDVLMSFPRDATQPGISWFENDGLGQLSAPVTLLQDCQKCNSIQLVDVDADGDVDIFGVQSGSVGPLGTEGGSFWFENSGGPSSLTPRRIVGAQTLIERVVLPDLDLDGDVDLIFAGTRFGTQLSQRLSGLSICAPAVPNSTGFPGALTLSGSRFPEQSALTLQVRSLPPGAFGMAITGRADSPPAAIPGSQGLLCLGAPLGRLVGPGQILAADAGGAFDLVPDLHRLPAGAGFIAALPGETWFFQVWYRDSNPTATSNLTNGAAVTFR